MKYPVILKHIYSYTSSGNYYKEEIREFYELYQDKDNFKTFSLGVSNLSTIKIHEFSSNNITFNYTYSEYAKPNTFSYDSNIISKDYSLKKGESVTIDCVEKYWVYARGGENAQAKLIIKWITLDELIEENLKKVEMNPGYTEKFVNFLLDEEQYDLAFKLISKLPTMTYLLGYCYENGFGVEKDLNKAYEIYLHLSNNAHCVKGLERLANMHIGKYILNNEPLDDVRLTRLYEKYNLISSMYRTAHIPLEINYNKIEDLRFNMELAIIKYLELGKPYNDPFSNPSHTLEHLAIYYDMINKYNNKNVEDKKYYEQWSEKDIYDGGEFLKESYDYKLIAETLLKEKDDCFAIIILLIKLYNYINNEEELLNILINKSNDGDISKRGLYNYFIGLYYEDLYYHRNDTNNNIEYLNNAYHYFEESLKYDFSLSAGHVAEKYYNENPINFYNTLVKHQKNIICYMSRFTSNYYMYLALTCFYDLKDYEKAYDYFFLNKYNHNGFYHLKCTVEKNIILLALNKKSDSEIFDADIPLEQPVRSNDVVNYAYLILLLSKQYSEQVLKYKCYESRKRKIIEEMPKYFDMMLQIANNGYAPGMKKIASWYYHGLGTTKDLDKAKYWLDKYNETIKNNQNLVYSVIGSLFDDGPTVINDKIYETLS